MKNKTRSAKGTPTYDIYMITPFSEILDPPLQDQPSSGLMFCLIWVQTVCKGCSLTCVMQLMLNKLKLCMLGNFPCFLLSADLLSKSTLLDNSFRNTECQTDWIQSRPDILSGLIWFQTVCKSYQQTTLRDKELMPGNFTICCCFF